jgi:hypothetical protein
MQLLHKIEEDSVYKISKLNEKAEILNIARHEHLIVSALFSKRENEENAQLNRLNLNSLEPFEKFELYELIDPNNGF